jgi:squalene-hopene/tetraprenyl-beta-curcumene cyclase
VFAGNVFLTEVGARFDEARQVTEISARNIAPTAEAAGKVELSSGRSTGADNKRKERVFTTSRRARRARRAWTWDGRGSDGKARPRGRYVAELVMRDARGKTIQKASTLFFHDSELEQKKKFAEIEGNLACAAAPASPPTRRSSSSTRTAGGADGALDCAGQLPLQERRGGQLPRAGNEGGLAKQEASVDAAPAAEAAKAN